MRTPSAGACGWRISSRPWPARSRTSRRAARCSPAARCWRSPGGAASSPRCRRTPARSAPNWSPSIPTIAASPLTTRWFCSLIPRPDEPLVNHGRPAHHRDADRAPSRPWPRGSSHARTRRRSRYLARACRPEAISRHSAWYAPFRDVRVWSPRNADAFAREHRVQAVASAEEAVRGADVVVVATTSRTPVLAGEWLSPGTHINAVGAVRPDWRELDDETLRRSRLYVESRESAMREAGDVIAAGEVFAEIGEVVAGTKPGRQIGRRDHALQVGRSGGRGCRRRRPGLSRCGGPCNMNKRKALAVAVAIAVFLLLSWSDDHYWDEFFYLYSALAHSPGRAAAVRGPDPASPPGVLFREARACAFCSTS